MEEIDNDSSEDDDEVGLWIKSIPFLRASALQNGMDHSVQVEALKQKGESAGTLVEARWRQNDMNPDPNSAVINSYWRNRRSSADKYSLKQQCKMG